MKEFVNEQFHDFTKPAVAKKQREALDAVRKKFGKEYPNFINGKKVKSEAKTISYNPANTSEVVGVFQKSGRSDAEKAMKAAVKAFETWKNVPAKERASYLFKAAAVVRRRRLEINAWMISEVGKNYLEADADTCEAIDFLEFYGREMLRYADKQPFEFVDLVEAFFPHLRRDNVVDTYNQHIFIMTAVEDDHFAFARYLLVDAPQEIMVEFFGGGCFERGYSHACGVDTVKHTTDRSILSACIHGL